MKQRTAHQVRTTLKKLMFNYHISQAEVAIASGLGASTVGSFLRREHGCCGPRVVAKLDDYLKEREGVTTAPDRATVRVKMADITKKRIDPFNLPTRVPVVEQPARRNDDMPPTADLIGAWIVLIILVGTFITGLVFAIKAIF